MKPRSKKIIGYICIAPVVLFFLFAAVMKFVPATPEALAMIERLGLSVEIEYVFGVLQLVILALYLIPRTSTVGFVLLVGYMGGALATNLSHGFSQAEISPIYVMFVLMTIGAYFLNPELLTRLKTGKA
jgi:hypothetical protein